MSMHFFASLSAHGQVKGKEVRSAIWGFSVSLDLIRKIAMGLTVYFATLG